MLFFFWVPVWWVACGWACCANRSTYILAETMREQQMQSYIFILYVAKLN